MAVAENLISLSTDLPAGAAVAARSEAFAVRAYFGLLLLLGLAAFVLNVRDRLTPDLFAVAPSVDLVPPLGDQAWYAAFERHQQDPVFAACGGSENLAQFKVLYWWEWLRRGSLVLLGGVFGWGFSLAAAFREYRSALKPLTALALIGLGYLAAFSLLDTARGEELARYDVGQNRHALDVTFGSAALALTLVSALAPPDLLRVKNLRPLGVILIALIVLDIGCGALFTARDAWAVWRDFPGYESGMLPPFEWLIAYAPWWLNFIFNQYMLQFVHRMLSIALWGGLMAHAAWSSRFDRGALRWASVLLALATAQMAIGIAALRLGAATAFAHEIGGIVLLAGAILAFAAPAALRRQHG